MLVNQTACDICGTIATLDEAGNINFSQLTLAGWGRAHVRHHHGPGASGIDLCPACAKSLADWLNDSKAKAKGRPAGAAVSPVPTSAATTTPATPTLAPVEPTHAEPAPSAEPPTGAAT